MTAKINNLKNILDRYVKTIKKYDLEIKNIDNDCIDLNKKQTKKNKITIEKLTDKKNEIKEIKEAEIIKIIDLYEPVEGHIYCIYNEMYKFYGEDIYKCGQSIEPTDRMNSYVTSYIKPCELKLVSQKFFDKNFAETLLFYFLKSYKIDTNREFFNCNIEIIKNAFDKVNDFFNVNNTPQKLLNYLLTDNIYRLYFNFNSVVITEEHYKKIFNNEQTELSFIFEDKIKNTILNRQQYLNNMKLTNEEKEILINNSDELLKYLGELCIKSNDNRQEKIEDIKNAEIISNLELNMLKNKLLSLSWLEKNLNINNYDLSMNENDNIEDIKDLLIKNIEEIYNLFKTNESKNKTILNINNKIKKINNMNKLNKFVADCYNLVSKNYIKISIKRIKISRHIVKNLYIFNKTMQI